MSQQLSEKNPHYTYSLVNKSEDLISNVSHNKNLIISYYILEGTLNFVFKEKQHKVLKDNVIIISGLDKAKNFNLDINSKVLEIFSKQKNKQTLLVEDNEGVRSESIISDYRIFNIHKKVEKPWGYEVWYAWLKDYHVLKKIFMKKGNKCSLQYHNAKYETNFLVSGKAKIIKGLYIDLKEEREKTFQKILSTDLIKDYSSIHKAPYVFTNVPGEVHRVYSEADYVAYEVSTPELDDVVRVQDDKNRPSGLIIEEHK